MQAKYIKTMYLKIWKYNINYDYLYKKASGQVLGMLKLKDRLRISLTYSFCQSTEFQFST